MGVDPLSPIAPARLRALLLPVGKIKRSRFLSFAARLQAENVVRLGDISPDARPNRNMFSPLAFPTGIILYDLTFSVPPTSHLELFPFEVHREPLVVIAVADGLELDGGNEQNSEESTVKAKNEASPTPAGLDQLRQELELLREKNPKALVHQLLIFDHEEVNKLLNGPDDILWIPRPEASKATTMKTVLCDITSLLLSELDGFARTMQSIPSIESPKASSWGPHRGPDIRPRPTDRLFHRMTMPAQLPSNPNGGTPETPLSSSQGSPIPSDHETPTTFDEITRSIQLSTRSNSVGKPNSLPSSKEHSRDRMSVSSMSATDRTKNRIKGRAGVVIGTLFLQAGRWPDALKELVEAASNARACSDYVWHAKALESILLCLLMFAWAGMDFQIPPICYPVADKSSKSSYNFESAPGQSTPGNRIISLQNLSNLLPDLSNNILNLYNRAANIANAPLPQLIFSETVIRLGRLLVAARIRDGALDDIALKHVVMGEPLQPLHRPERPRGLVILRKSEIANFLLRALPLSPGSDLPPTDAIPIMIGVVSVFDTLGLPRKKAFILRELLSILVPTLVQARKIGAAEVGIHPAAGLASLSDTAFDINALDVGPGNMEESMRSLLATIGEIYGVQPSSFCEWQKRRSTNENGTESFPEYDSVVAIVERSFRHAVLDGYGDLNLKIDVLKACINSCEALPDFGGVLRFTVELLQTIRGDLMLAETLHTPPCLPQDEQIRLLNNIKRTVGAANKLGASGLEAEYWDDFLVRGVQLLALPDSRSPVRRSKSELDVVTADREKSSKDPFLYNPFHKPSNKTAELLMVAGEHAAFQLTLQNPYEFEVEIEKLRLDYEGVPLDATAEWIVLRPLSLQDVTVFGLAQEEGVVNITGCFVKVRHCRERRFPIFKDLWRPEAERKFKRTGLAAKQPSIERPLSWGSTTSRDGKQLPKKGPDTSSCEIKVIGRQPSLLIESLSLLQSAFMVLEGEVGSFKITLRNTSSCPLDFILFTFQDSTTRQIQNALSNRDLLPVEVYELELKLSKPALRWRREGKNPGDHSIPPGECAIFTVDVTGKPGLQDTTVQIDYSCIGQSHSELPDVFYTRQLFVPLTVTVNASIEIARCDILPFSGDFAWWNCREAGAESEYTAKENTDVSPCSPSSDVFSPVLSHLGQGTYGSDHCLLLLDLRNAWPNPLTVSLQANSQPVEPSERSIEEAELIDGRYVVSGELQPGQTSRFVLVLPRVYLDNPHASIPVLNTGMKRQFVVSAHKLSFDAEAASREAFWYREELLKRVSGFWKESPAGRKGMVDLRNLRFSARMVDAFRLEDVDIRFALSSSSSDIVSPNGDSVVQIGRSKYRVQIDEMLSLNVTISNRSSRPIHPLLRLQPSLRHQPNSVALDLSKRLAWTGMLQQVLPLLHSGESTTATVGVTILCRGEYEFGASVEELRFVRPSPGTESDTHPQAQASFHDDEGPIKDTFGIDVAKKRHIWHAKEACVMNAHG
ncbi:hypercellular protein HypA [Aspergillus nomiae NRRL 13137]|uniref:Hypercellular protein HypA n=1 Tax=Aspergillus nomiae NRRL (strain ATCC 15546 / NRRL 13137 / CBS 260.88 / M93) TaxID=1509407 RepID=A0A0L1IQ08_ASPN3|nr:hypercellular protein HypA [Aspergillus nomiae NRRL 13137]KNG81333.1 hypercellular protein HypA [Aspergillus nomiae NRRL 13137]